MTLNILRSRAVKPLSILSKEPVHTGSRFHHILLLLFLTIAISSVPSCRTKYNPDYVNKSEFMTNGWVDNNTLRISASGEPRKNIASVIQKKFSAKDAALKSARLKLTQKFQSKKNISSIRVDENYAGTNTETDEILSAIRNGKILKETYDDEQVCDIVYEITSPGLKKKIPGSSAE